MNYKIKDFKIGSSNLNKLKDYDDLGIGIPTVKIPDVREVDGTSPQVIIYKLIDFNKDNIILEDTSFVIDGYEEEIGINVRWKMNEINHNKKYDGLPACWLVLLGFKKENEVYLFQGEVYGVIDQSKYDSKSFGFDSIFVPEGSFDSLFELSSKNKKFMFSARNMALKKVLDNEWDVMYDIADLEPWEGKYQK